MPSSPLYHHLLAIPSFSLPAMSSEEKPPTSLDEPARVPRRALESRPREYNVLLFVSGISILFIASPHLPRHQGGFDIVVCDFRCLQKPLAVHGHLSGLLPPTYVFLHPSTSTSLALSLRVLLDHNIHPVFPICEHRTSILRFLSDIFQPLSKSS